MGIILGDGEDAIKIVPVDTMAGIPLMHQPMICFHKEIPGLLMCHEHSHMIICTTYGFNFNKYLDKI
jgi:hypothetical protein